MLADWQIEELCTGGQEMIKPFAKGEKRPNQISYGLTSYGYDIRIGNKFKVFTATRCARIDPKAFNPFAYDEIEMPDHQQMWIPGNGHVLGESVEVFNIPRHLLVLCIGKSTYARTSLIVNVTPLEPEWTGKLTIEISNTSPLPVAIYPGEGIAQLLFSTSDAFFYPNTINRTCIVSYRDKKGKYQDQKGLVHSKVD